MDAAENKRNCKQKKKLFASIPGQAKARAAETSGGADGEIGQTRSIGITWVKANLSWNKDIVNPLDSQPLWLSLSVFSQILSPGSYTGLTLDLIDCGKHVAIGLISFLSFIDLSLKTLTSCRLFSLSRLFSPLSWQSVLRS